MFSSEEEFKKIIAKAQVDTRPDPVYRRNLHRQMLLTFEAQKPKPDAVETPAFETKNPLTIKFIERLKTMKNISKIAAAFIIVAGIIGMTIVFTHTGKPTFAEVIQPLLNARTVTFKITVNIEGLPEQTQQGMYMEPGLLRQTTAGGGVHIYDFTQGKALVLVEGQKMALQMENLPENQGGFFEVREMIRQAQENEGASVEYLGEKQIEGQNAVGYRIHQQRIEMEIWADADHKHPIRVAVDMSELLGKNAQSVMHDIAFDVELDQSLFSLEIPEDYKVISNPLDASQNGEEALINLLGMTRDIPGSQFPDALTMAGMENVLKSLKSKFEGRQMDKEEQIQQAVTLMAPLMGGLTFLQFLPDESDWHYVGKGVKVGQSDTPIFWYKPEGSDTYRVIYADLTVKDLPADQLPAAPDAQTKDSQKSVMEVPEVIKK